MMKVTDILGEVTANFLDRFINRLCREICISGNVKGFESVGMIASAWADMQENGVTEENVKQFKSGVLKTNRRIDREKEVEVYDAFVGVKEVFYDDFNGLF